MKITVNRLRHVLALTQTAVSVRGPLPITRNVLFKEGFAVTTNLETSVAVDLRELGEEESFLLPHKLLVDSLKTRPGNAMLDITEEDGKVAIKCENPVFSMNYPAGVVEDFPDFPVFDRLGGGEVDGDVLVSNVLELVPYAGKDQKRPMQTGICFTMGEELEVAAADGFRLAWRTIPLTLLAGDGQNPRVVVPANTFKTLAQLWKIAEKRPRQQGSFDVEKLNGSPQLQVASMAIAKRYMQVGFGDNHISFSLGEATLVSQIIQGTFPDYTHFIPTESTHKVVFDAAEAYRALLQLTPIASAKSANNIIRLKWTRNSLTLSATGEDVGESEATVAAATEGRASHIAFNLPYLVELLRNKEGRVLMETTTPSSPGRFTHSKSPNIVIMGMFVRHNAAAAVGEPAVEPTENGEDEDDTAVDD